MPSRLTDPAAWRRTALVAASALTLAACGAAATPVTNSAGPTTTAPPAPSASAPAPTATATATATADVAIVDFKFTPAALTVKAGTTVVWTNKDSIAHTVDFAAGAINSNTLNQNDRFTHTFATPGTYDYICSIHPFMHGTVTVTG